MEPCNASIPQPSAADISNGHTVTCLRIITSPTVSCPLYVGHAANIPTRSATQKTGRCDMPYNAQGEFIPTIPNGSIVTPTENNTYGLPTGGVLGEVLEWAGMSHGRYLTGYPALLRTEELYRVKWFVSEHTTRVLTMELHEIREIPEG